MATVLESPLSTATLPCKHCGEATAVAALEEHSDVFCCSGCQGAYRLIRGLGLDNYYAVRDSQPAAPLGDDAVSSSIANEEFLLEQGNLEILEDGSHRALLAIQGIHCGACSWLIENALLRQPGVHSTRVRMNDHCIEIQFRPEAISLGEIDTFLGRLGYRLVAFDPKSDSHLVSENSRHLTRIAFSGFLAANTMWIAIALYAGASSGHAYFLGLAGACLGVVALLGPGRIFLQGAWAAIKTRTPHMDMPVSLGLLAGTLVGTYNAMRGIGHVYFDSIAALVFLLSIGRWLQFRQQQHASQAVELMMKLTPQQATKISNGTTQKTTIANLSAGDTIEVLSGECIPVDGTIAKCSTTPLLDCSLLTGESNSVKVELGGNVAAGTINVGPPLQISVTSTGKATRLGQILESVEAAVRQRTPIVMLADRVGGYFVVCVTILALLAFALWIEQGLDVAITHSTALLIVACPCALALATPLAIAVGIGRAAKRGILIRDGSVFQHMAKAGEIWLDKTGTLTEGKQRVTSVHGNTDGLRAAAILELECEHPIARAVRLQANEKGITLTRIAKNVSKESNGILGDVDGKQIAVGNTEFLLANGYTISRALQNASTDLLERGESPIFVGINKRAETLLGLSDPIRPETQSLLHELESRGWTVGILSGDHTHIVQRVGCSLGISAERCLGDKTPEQKLEIVKHSQVTSRVVMVGDGANDAAALAAADVGIAVRGGAEASLHAAPVFLAQGPSALSSLLHASTRVQRMIYVTFGVSLSYNMLAVGLALGGWITPLVAAVLMPISSLSVLALTIGGHTFKENSE